MLIVLDKARSNLNDVKLISFLLLLVLAKGHINGANIVKSNIGLCYVLVFVETSNQLDM